MRRLAVLSLHTSPLAQPGTGDSGGMNVYVRELSAAVAQAGVGATVYTRRTDPTQPDVVAVEPGFEVVHVDAGDPALPKEHLPQVIDQFTDEVLARLRGDRPADAVHANYWLSAVAGHRIKHDLGLPLISTFHTLARVKTASGDPEPPRRAAAEAAVIGCSDAILASCATELVQLRDLYGADPHRIEIVPPGVDHAFFSPGARAGARAALGLGPSPVVLFAGRIQPLKGLGVAVEALAELADPEVTLVVVGGPSGAEGRAEEARLHQRIAELGLVHQVRWVPPQPHHLLATFFRAADVCVVPSRSESFGLVALEAAACGIPTVASAVGGLQSLIIDGHTGLLVEGRDPIDWARALRRLLYNPRAAATMGAAAAHRARSYTWSIAAARLRRIADDVISQSLVDCAA